jgi:hypothetical protein
LTSSIIEAIDREILHLEQVRAILADTSDVNLSTATGKKRARKAGAKNLKTSISPTEPTVKKRGRPAGTKNSSKADPVKAKRVTSEEGKTKIAAGQSKRRALPKKTVKVVSRTPAAKKTASSAVAKKATAKRVKVKKAASKRTPVKTAPVTETPTPEATL